MHIKTNIEISSVQMAALAICPLLLVLQNFEDALFFIVGTIVCVLLSQLFCIIFNKYMSNNVKSFVSSLISAFVVTIAFYVSDMLVGFELNQSIFYVVFSSVILNVDFIYIKKKAATKFYLFSVVKSLILFSLMLSVFAAIKEFLSFGTILNYKLFEFTGLKFFETITFSLFLLATLCFIFDIVVRDIEKKNERRKMAYQKLVKNIRDEKVYLYDRLRREKLLTNDVEVNKIGNEDAEKILKKVSENEAIESVEQVLSEETEEDATESTSSAESGETQTDESTDKKPKKEGKKNKKDDKEDE